MPGIDKNSVLVLDVQDVEFIYDQNDTNALNCKLRDGYFCIQNSVYLEEDEYLNEPFLEMNDQSNAQCGGIAEIFFNNDDVVITFKEAAKFIKTYSKVKLAFSSGVNRQIVDFFNNQLFLGEIVRYSMDFDERNVVAATATRDML